MPVNKSQKTKPRSIRFSDEEWSAIDEKRGHISTSAFVRQCVLGALNRPRRKSPTAYSPSETRTQLAQVLALLGKSRASGALREILDLARLGALPVTPELETKVAAACDDIKTIKTVLIKTLGLKGD